ncbi:Cupin domain protein [Candidatus Sulfobium mesophilum]|uniref:Cupin domain protein n=1 Tax=Candidatus Sulfobium mesophilum TaxID=2016548 RepID=A0A2U3QHL2_9BACT|nr:Cupin domain protein [Candidatus Sulfobium mesophilum]
MKNKSLRQTSFCEIGSSKKICRKDSNRCALYRYKGDMTWQGIADEPYKTAADGWSNIVRRVLIGGRGESAKFHVRYFEIAPGGTSSLERHRHEHVVICVKGEGVVRTGRTRRKMRYMDTLYISPDTVHQLRNPNDVPFGFLCIVNARRDKPKVLA